MYDTRIATSAHGSPASSRNQYVTARVPVQALARRMGTKSRAKSPGLHPAKRAPFWRHSGDFGQIKLRGDTQRIGRHGKFNLTQQRRAKPLGQRRDVLIGNRHRRVDAIGDPAGEAQSAFAYGPRGQQRVVETTQTQADDENDRQAQALRKVRGIFMAIQRNAKMDAAQVNELMKLKPDVLIYTVLSAPAAEISRELASRKLTVPKSSLSFVGAQQYIAAAGESGAGVSIAQVVPNISSTKPVVGECAKALKEAGITTVMNSTHLEACIAAKVLTEAMRRAKKPGNSDTLLTAMRQLGTYDSGGFVVSYGPGQQHGSKFVELVMVSREGRLR